jgi:hypothetical protein
MPESQHLPAVTERDCYQISRNTTSYRQGPSRVSVARGGPDVPYSSWPVVGERKPSAVVLVARSENPVPWLSGLLLLPLKARLSVLLLLPLLLLLLLLPLRLLLPLLLLQLLLPLRLLLLLLLLLPLLLLLQELPPVLRIGSGGE